MARIGEILVALGACRPEAIEAALQNQSSFGARLGTNLLQLGSAKESQVAAALEQLHGLPSVSGDVPADPEAISLVRKPLVEKYEIVPFMIDGRKLAVLTRDPRDCNTLDAIAFATGRNVCPFVVAEARLWALMRKLYGIERGPRGVDVDRPTSARRLAANAPVAVPAMSHWPETPATADLMDEANFAALYTR